MVEYIEDGNYLVVGIVFILEIVEMVVGLIVVGKVVKVL